jgi:hypothetical protein
VCTRVEQFFGQRAASRTDFDDCFARLRSKREDYFFDNVRVNQKILTLCFFGKRLFVFFHFQKV